ncbi:hypothetical protein SAMN05192555_11850 [Franzmannia pantelleriensis]|uniref:Uncharacterized protein n=1 Tax=Franzmannia pantelleriensis TaxID=48727 RepID=A0A1G9VMK4_9GAMM|nr:hypothetical protein [Halomonas pantelleriensis]SDM73424.1 hypothetical protein SAMN05192555_11850 [Halomonas pantelleriensis]
MDVNRERTLLGIVLWGAAAISAPVTTLMVLRVGGLPTLGVGALSVALFGAALLCTHINQQLDDLVQDDELSDEEWETHFAEESLQCSGLRVLRIGEGSPLKGHISERAVILKINGVCPVTADEANHALVEGRNEIEWMGRNRKPLVAHITTQGNEHDLLAQFEQLNPSPAT